MTVLDAIDAWTFEAMRVLFGPSPDKPWQITFDFDTPSD